MEIVLALADVRGLIQALIYRKTQVMLGSVNAACRVHCAFIRMDALSDCRQAYEDHRRHYGKAHRHRALHGGGVDQAMPHATAPPSAAAETEDTGAPPSAVAEPAATAEVQAGLVDGATTAVTEDTEVVDDSPVTDAAPWAPEEEDEAAGTSAASAGAQADAHRELKARAAAAKARTAKAEAKVDDANYRAKPLELVRVEGPGSRVFSDPTLCLLMDDLVSLEVRQWMWVGMSCRATYTWAGRCWRPWPGSGPHDPNRIRMCPHFLVTLTDCREIPGWPAGTASAILAPRGRSGSLVRRMG